jgi:polysaccharide chain length determinant protein (PEP-CTERM system associated)
MGGLLYSRSQQSLYRSDAVVQVVPQRIPDTYVQSTVTARVQDRLSSIAQQVLSRTELESVIADFDLYPALRAALPMEDVISAMADRIEVAPLVGSASNREIDGFRISFDYADPKVAREVVARLAGFFIDRNAQERGLQADQTSAFLEAQLVDARSRLEAQEKKLEAFRERNSGRLPTQTQTNMQAIQNSQMALQATVESLARDRDRKLMLERLYTDALSEAEALGSAAAPPLDTAAPALVSPRVRLEDARQQLAQMELRLSEKHPDVVRTRRQVAELERLAAEEQSGRPTAAAGTQGEEGSRRRERLREMRAELELLDRQISFKEGEEGRLRGEIHTYQARIEAVPAIESEWIALTRDYDTVHATYRSLLEKSENSKIAASLEQLQIGEQFRMLDPPRIPARPFSPNRLKINLLGLLAGLGLGLLLVGLAEYRDTSMRSEADALGAIDFPLLVLLPFVPSAADLRKGRRRRITMVAAVAIVSAGTSLLAWLLELWKYVA